MNANSGFSFRRFFAKVSLIGFGSSLFVHLIACLGLNVTDNFPFVWLLHLGIFVVFIPMEISIMLEKGNASDEGISYDLVSSIPRKSRYIAGFFFVYMLLNFILFFAQSYEGSPETKNGKYVLYSNGKASQRYIIRELSEAEYNLRQAQILRGFSGHWMFFYLLPTLHFNYFGRQNKSNYLKKNNE
ncbi:MAG: hypothetical protein HC846_12390 [Blastocatellia bacterium]|nr:hypothetical protein [Blastocatellia bacterium]